MEALVYTEPPDEAAALLEFRRRLEVWCRCHLTGRQVVVLKRRFGFDGLGGATLREISKDLRVRPERVRQIEAKVLRLLRAAPWTQGFSSGASVRTLTDHVEQAWAEADRRALRALRHRSNVKRRSSFDWFDFQKSASDAIGVAVARLADGRPETFVNCHPRIIDETVAAAPTRALQAWAVHEGVGFRRAGQDPEPKP